MVEKYIIDSTNYTGRCPECDADWDLGEAPDVWLKNNATSVPQDIARQLAENDSKLRGWTPENKMRVSSLITIENSDNFLFDTTQYYQCTHCEIAWKKDTGERTDLFKIPPYMKMSHDDKIEFITKNFKKD